MSKNDRERHVILAFLFSEVASERGFHSQERKQILRHPDADETLRLPYADHGVASVVEEGEVCRKLLECSRCLLPFEKGGNTRRDRGQTRHGRIRAGGVCTFLEWQKATRTFEELAAYFAF